MERFVCRSEVVADVCRKKDKLNVKTNESFSFGNHYWLNVLVCVFSAPTRVHHHYSHTEGESCIKSWDKQTNPSFIPKVQDTLAWQPGAQHQRCQPSNQILNVPHYPLLFLGSRSEVSRSQSAGQQLIQCQRAQFSSTITPVETSLSGGWDQPRANTNSLQSDLP